MFRFSNGDGWIPVTEGDVIITGTIYTLEEYGIPVRDAGSQPTMNGIVLVSTITAANIILYAWRYR